jgi:ATP-dependent helicase/nuclease subunit A
MLTRQQQKALALHHHLSVTANAGTGKTTVLVNRFLNILLETDATVQQLVAITFTEKAASELRVKIAAQVRERLSTATGIHRRRLEYVRDQLAGANIGTIHSFCAQLLRDFPIEANIDAGFTILEGVDQQFLINESLQDTFDQVLNDHTPFSNEVLGVVRMIGAGAVERYLKMFLQKREQIERLIKGPLSADIPDAVILDRWEKLLNGYISAMVSDERVQKILNMIHPNLNGKRAQECSSLIVRFLGAREMDEKISYYRQCIDTLLTQQGTLRKEVCNSRILPPGLEADVSLLHRHRKIFNEVIDTVDPSHTANATLLRTTKILLDLYQLAENRYAEKKSDTGQLDFDDLQFSALALLRNESVRVTLSTKYRFLMIDEFQDTNHLQYEILRLLVSHFETGNLFIVGDPKQSIYGFRNAEVEIFEQSKSDIGKANDDTGGSSIVLTESFRLLPSIADFINRVFATLMDSKSSPFDVGYEELISARGIDAEGTIDLLLVPPPGDSEHEADNAIMVECRMIARFLIQLLEKGYIIHGKENDDTRPFSFGDAAILVRRRTHLPEIEQALTEFNIPYILTGGIGYYQTQEVYDFLNYLKFLINTDDDVALGGILRSPFFTISDAELFEISLEKGTDSFWLKVNRYCNKHTSSKQLSRSIAILTDHLQLANRISIPQLIQRVLNDTGWSGTMNGLHPGLQSRANIEKLLLIAREFESRGFLSLYDFIERIKTLSEEEDREGQAAIESKTPVVRVMTIHAAKGLEFPVVILPFLDQTFRYDQHPYLDPTLGIGFKVADNQNFDLDVTPPFCHYLKQRMNLRTEAEEKRIFYVATTRAMENLVLAGSLENVTARPSCLRWTLEALGISPDSIGPGTITMNTVQCKILDRARGNEIVETQHPLPLQVSFPDDLRSVAGRKLPGNEKIQTREFILPDIAGTRGEEYFSATQIKTYLECPTKFYLKHVLGIPEIKSIAYGFDESEDSNDDIRGDIVGSITHTILQHLNNTFQNPELLRDRITEHVTAFPSISVITQPAYIEEIQKNVVNLLESTFGRQILSAAESKTELSLTMSIGDDFLTGTIDRLLKTPSGQWKILDYKTDGIPVDKIAERANLYKPQLSVYSLLVSTYFNQPSVEASLVFLKYPDKPVHFLFDRSILHSFRLEVDHIVEDIKESHFGVNLQSCSNCAYFLNGCSGKQSIIE